MWKLGFVALVAVTVIDAKFFSFGPTIGGDQRKREFNVYWNVPTFVCHKYGMNFEEAHRDFGIIQNRNDAFRGDRFAILYDPGMFPALLKDKSGEVVKRNGGVPQKGNLSRHLETFTQHLKTQIPNEDFFGIGVIDFESWRPIFRQNWASLKPYKDLSIKLVHKEHPQWSDKAVEREAAARFEKNGVKFMFETMQLAKSLRPNATWGYYAYPYCFNLTPSQPGSKCDARTMDENDEMTWLFKDEDVFLPSVYIRKELSKSERVGLVEGRVREATRVAKKLHPNALILAYHWFKYQDDRDSYLTTEDLEATMQMISRAGAHGAIIWGSSDDVNTKEKCQKLKEYLNDVMGPIIVKVRKSAAQKSILDYADGNALENVTNSD
uniref:Hyaluronidase n=1 Tax=Anoplius samariensis TaxID=200614 RepID=A9EDG0_ANOSM|nr:hyaluronidase [Anoplius samariensis]